MKNLRNRFNGGARKVPCPDAFPFLDYQKDWAAAHWEVQDWVLFFPEMSPCILASDLIWVLPGFCKQGCIVSSLPNMEGCCLTKTHLSITSCVSKLSTSKFFWRSQGIILLSQDKIVLINTSNHCNICTSESVPLPWAVLFQPCHDFSQCLTWACLCKTHCNNQTNETQKGRKKTWHKNPLPASPKQKWGRMSSWFLKKKDKWEVTACGSAHLCGTEKIENTGVLRYRLNFLGSREGYCTETVITPYINTGRYQCTKSRAALSEDSEPCTGAMPLQCALCSRELKKRVERTLHASSFPDKVQLVYVCCSIPCKSLQKPS